MLALLLVGTLACRSPQKGDTAPAGPADDTGNAESELPPDSPASDSGVSIEHSEDSGPLGPSGLCPSAEAHPAAQPRLWAFDGDTLLLALEGGEVVEAHRFTPPSDLPSQRQARRIAMARGEFLAAAVAWRSHDAIHGSRYAAELLLLDRLGAPVAWTDQAQAPSERILLGAQGVVAHDRGHEALEDGAAALSGQVLHPDGRLTPLDPWVPVGPPRSEGFLPACSVDDSRCAWVAIDGSEHRRERQGRAAETLATANRVVFLQGSSIVSEGPDEALETLLVPAFLPEQLPELELLDSQDEGWVLVGLNPRTHGLGALARFDARSGALQPLSLQPPTGYRLLDPSPCPSPALRVDSAGELDLALRDDEALTLFHTDIQGSAWQPLGPRLLDIAGAWTLENAGTLQILAGEGSDAGCALPPWGEASGAVSGASYRALRHQGEEGVLELRPSPELAGAWPPQPHSISGDGLCLVRLEATGAGPSVVVYDLPSASRTVLDLPAVRWRWF